MQRQINEHGGKDGHQIQAPARSHANGRNHKDRCSRRDPAYAAFVMQDGTCADEADARNDLRGDARVVADAERAPNSVDRMVNRADPKHINILVRSPAGLRLSSRSRPIIPPRTAASTSRTIAFDSRSSSVMCGKARASMFMS